MIGEVDFSSALTTVHPKPSTSTRASNTTWTASISISARPTSRVNIDYYTDAIRYTQVRVLEIAEESRSPNLSRRPASVQVASRPALSLP